MRTLVALTLLSTLALGCTSPDVELKRRVDDSLREVQPPESVEATVDRRVVTLRGVVSSDKERNHVTDVVRSVYGVLAVDDRLRVEQPPSLTGGTTDAAAP